MNKVYIVTYFGKRKSAKGTESGCAGVFTSIRLAEKFCDDFAHKERGSKEPNKFGDIEFKISPYILNEGLL